MGAIVSLNILLVQPYAFKSPPRSLGNWLNPRTAIMLCPCACGLQSNDEIEPGWVALREVDIFIVYDALQSIYIYLQAVPI